MTLKPIANNAVAQICKTVSVPIPYEERVSVSRIVEQAVIDAVASASQQYAGVVKSHASLKAELAHKITERLEQAQAVLIANLTGTR
ncbi:MAG: hypothetical protein ACR2QH_09275 [Geminicoccaceae bacterium]